MPTLEPGEWDAVYSGASGRGFVFRRGVELTLDVVRTLAQPRERWLDIGCGTGRLVCALAETGVLAIGADADARMISFAARRAPAAGSWLVSRAERLPCRDDTLDGVVATSLMGCVDDVGPVWSEIRRVLRPGGCAVLTFTNRESLLLRLNHAVGRRQAQGYRSYRVGQVVEGLRASGLDVLAVRYYNFVLTVGPVLVPPSAVARRFECSGPAWLARRTARNFVVVVRKG